MNPSLIQVGLRLSEAGFSGVCVTLYLLAVVLSGGYSRVLVWVALPGALLLVIYQLFLSYIAADAFYVPSTDGTLRYAYESIWVLLYGYLALATIAVVWQRRRKIGDSGLQLGLIWVACGVMLEVISPQLRQRALSLDVGIFGMLWLNYVQVRLQIVRPLVGREAELRGFRDVGLAITSRLKLDEALKTLAAQAASLLHADGAAIFLLNGSVFELVAVHNMPERLIGHELTLGEGLTGKVAIEQRAGQVEDYRRDWRGAADMPYARETFGAVVAVPLIFDNVVLGVLIVVENPYGKRFGRDDVRLLEMLGPQAAVAIANSRLFEQQQELDRLKNQMIRMTSHDLKNPLFAAMEHVELLQDEGAGLFTDEMQADLRTIWTQLERMNRIIRGILDMERVQSGTPTYESFDMGELVRMAVAELTDQAAAHRIALCTELPDVLPPMVGDRHYLMQALINLIENAIKFTPGAGTICVRAEYTEGNIIWHVSDTGVGIPPEAQLRIFERFYRAHQNHPGLQQVSGSGLGLSLVKAVADAHGGRIWLESAVGQGTTFHVALPIAGP